MTSKPEQSVADRCAADNLTQVRQYSKEQDSNQEGYNDPSVVVTDKQFVLLAGSVFLIAACSLIYELLISSLSSYLLGSSVIHYSITIGLFLFFMGVGAWFAQSVKHQLVAVFISIEIAIGAVGGISALLLLFVYAHTQFYYPLMIVVIGVIGILVGMELPLLTRILESRSGLRRSISQVLTFDYIGALAASLLFPFILLPYFGHLLTAALIGLLNLFVACVVAWSFRNHLTAWRGRVVAGVLATALMLVACLFLVKPAELAVESALYEDPVIETRQTRYQKIVLTQLGDDLRLYLNGNLQFSSIDEYRYHEVLVHVPAAFAGRLQRALIIGGGDGLAARELLKYQSINSIDIVELDNEVIRIATEQPMIAELNEGAFRDDRVTSHTKDAWTWLAAGGNLYDLVIVDLPDPENEDLAKLYSVAFYQRVARRLAVGGVVMTQATSPWFARRAFWSIGATMNVVFENTMPATVYVPSFGLWGFFMAANHQLDSPVRSVFNGRYMNDKSLPQVLQMPADLPRLPVEVNRSQSLPVIRYYREGWESLNMAVEPIQSEAAE